MSTTTVTTRAVKGSALTHTEMDTNWNNLLGATVYVGTTMIWWTDTAPDSKWLICAGQSLATASYPDLFTLLGYKYGGSGASFNLPDTRGLFIRGWDNGAGNDPSASTRTDRGDGATGDVVGTNQDFATESHTHPSVGGHSNVISSTTGGNIEAGGGVAGAINQPMGTGSGNVAPETRPRNISATYIIKALK